VICLPVKKYFNVTCKTDGCDRHARCNGYCLKCYMRLYHKERKLRLKKNTFK